MLLRELIMGQPADRYDRWKAPPADGQILIWPSPTDLLAEARENQRRLSSSEILIQNVPLSELRRQMRQWIGHDDRLPLIATGHQAELHHPGVWVKNALIDAAARKVGGRAVHFAVDTDEPKHLSLRWPGGSAALVGELAAPLPEWSGLLPPPDADHLCRVEQSFTSAAAQWRFTPLVPDFLRLLGQLSTESSNLPQALTRSLQSLDRDLGLGYEAMTISPACSSQPYLAFVHHVLAHADQFASDYNEALEQYRAQNRIKAPGRPMPNLKLTPECCEVPVWLDSLVERTRSRACVIRSGDQWSIRAGDAEFRFDPAADGSTCASELSLWLRGQGLRLSPRALTLTCVLRLLVADQFVHGIGGGQYDQVLDALIARHWGLEPPTVSVTTATLFFPDALDEPRVCLRCIIQEGHRLKHGILGDEKLRLVEQIAALPRRSAQRSALFFRMHDKLTAAWAMPPVRQWEQRLRQAEERAQVERVLFDRELFYAVQPRHRLTSLIDRYREQFA